MDILGLPVVVHRVLMKKVTIKDRLSLRLTCRAFERLVADTDAGLIDCGHAGLFYQKGDANLCIMNIDNVRFKLNSANAPELLLNLRNRLFRKIIFKAFTVKPDPQVPSDFTRELLGTFTIQRLHFDLDSEYQIDASAQLVSHFPEIKRTMHVYLHRYPLLQSIACAEKFRNIPRMAELSISRPPMERWSVFIPGEIFMHLVATHEELVIHRNCMVLPRDLKRAMKIIALKKVEVFLNASCCIVKKWLARYGIKKDTENGPLSGECTHVWQEWEPDGCNMCISYGDNCTIRIQCFSWDGYGECLLTIYGRSTLNVEAVSIDNEDSEDESETDDSSASENGEESEESDEDEDSEENASDQEEEQKSGEDETKDSEEQEDN